MSDFKTAFESGGALIGATFVDGGVAVATEPHDATSEDRLHAFLAVAAGIAIEDGLVPGEFAALAGKYAVLYQEMRDERLRAAS